ncbi:MAG: kelch repeat-containing protein, partial [Rubricoccaceae bacterium]|nr:kelch repeat-containing protein [Rubricoccaceae bacterium]
NLALTIRTSGLQQVSRLEINGSLATMGEVSGVFLDTLQLVEGINAVFVDAFSSGDVVGSDTLYAAYFPYEMTNVPNASLPSPRAGHTATHLQDGRILVAGGLTSDGQVSGSAFLLEERGGDFSVSTLSDELEVPRTGHTASLLPDGRVIIVGGSTTEAPTSPSQLVTLIETFDPTTNSFSTLPAGGEAILRSQHTEIVLEGESGTYLYVFGGRGPIDTAPIGTRGDVSVLEYKSTAEGDSIINLSPGGAIGAFPAVSNHTQLPLSRNGPTHRSLVAGTYVLESDLSFEAVAFRKLASPSSFFFPFELVQQDLPAMRENRVELAAALLRTDIAVLFGGRSPEGDILRSLELFSDQGGQFFSFPSSTALRVPRRQHTATLLPSGRILVLGGIDAFGTTLSSGELLLPTSP